MLAFDRQGEGAPLLLLHGTNSSREVWDPIITQLSAHCEVIRVDLPAHGLSPPTSFTPPAFALDLSEFLAELGLHRPAVLGHSVGGWTALELAKLGQVSSVLALAPAGLWRRRSPLLTDIGLSASWRLGRLLGPSIVEKSLARPLGRRAGLGWISAQAQELPRQLALQSARAAIASKHFPEHFRQTRKLRFTDGHLIPATVAIRVIWGERDHVAPANRSRSMSELPGHARSETWPECGHMIMWDQMAQTIQAALETVHVQSSPPLALPD